MNHLPRCRRTPSIVAVAAFALWALVAGCDTSVEPIPTPLELVSLTLSGGADESILFSSGILYDQRGTDQFVRAVDSIHRGLENPRFWLNDQDFPSARWTFEGNVVDTAFGTLTFKIGGTTHSVPYLALRYGGFAQLVELVKNQWDIWRMKHRGADRPNQQGEPRFISMSVSDGSRTYDVIKGTRRETVRIFKDSVLTLPVGSQSSVTVTVQTGSIDDSLFVTYPTAAGCQTDVMNHTDSVTHTASVTVESGRRFELLAVQAFKRRAFTYPTYAEAAASVVQTAILAFR